MSAWIPAPHWRWSSRRWVSVILSTRTFHLSSPPPCSIAVRATSCWLGRLRLGWAAAATATHEPTRPDDVALERRPLPSRQGNVAQLAAHLSRDCGPMGDPLSEVLIARNSSVPCTSGTVPAIIASTVLRARRVKSDWWRSPTGPAVSAGWAQYGPGGLVATCAPTHARQRPPWHSSARIGQSSQPVGQAQLGALGSGDAVLDQISSDMISFDQAGRIGLRCGVRGRSISRRSVSAAGRHATERKISEPLPLGVQSSKSVGHCVRLPKPTGRRHPHADGRQFLAQIVPICDGSSLIGAGTMGFARKPTCYPQ